MNVSGSIASSVPSKGMNDLYQKINKYVYEIRMTELDEYLYGMNRQKIDNEKAYDIINDITDSLILFWKAAFVDPYCKDDIHFELCRFAENESRAIALYEKALELNIEGMAEDGDTYACVWLGEMYENGWGVDTNYPKAVKWYRKAAELGHANAQYNLGRMYHHGRSLDHNYSTAVEWYRKAAEQGHVYAPRYLGEFYEYVEKNYSTAVEWYHKAAGRGDAIAQRDLDRLTQSPRKKKRL